MRLPELSRLHPVRAPEVETLAVLVELHQTRVRPVDDPHVAVTRQHDVVSLAEIRPYVERLARLIEDLHAAIRAIGDVDASVLINGDAVHAAQLPRAVALGAKRRYERAVLVEPVSYTHLTLPTSD